MGAPTKVADKENMGFLMVEPASLLSVWLSPTGARAGKVGEGMDQRFPRCDNC